MSPKKPYQKRLPTVLPPAPRRAPAQETVRPRPAPPRARRTPPAGPSVAPPPEQPSEQPSEQPPAPTPDPTLEAAPATTPASAAAPAPVTRSAPAPTTPEPAPATPAPPTESAPRRSGPQTRRTLALVAAALAGVIGGGVLAWQVVGQDEATRTPTASLPIDGWPIAGESRTVSEVLTGGDLEVTHWIHADDPLSELRLSLPQLDGQEVSATEVEVTADGRPGSGPEAVEPRGASYTFTDATRIQVRYRMSGAVQLSSSADGRGLATTTSLDVTATQARDVRVVRSQEVLSLACAEPGEQPVPCGESGGDDEWRVELDGTDPGDRVLAVVTVPS